MAEAMIIATVKVTVEKLLAFAVDEIGLVLGFKEELTNLKKSFEMIWAFLHDVSRRQIEGDQAVKLWLKNLQDVAYAADNLLDEFNYEILRRKQQVRNQKKRKVLSFFLDSNPLGFTSKMARKIKNLNIKLKTVNEEASRYGLQNRVADSAISFPPVRETDSITVDPIVLGRENDVLEIVDKMVKPNNEVVSIVPIVGMGGIGKTALARLIFNHQRTVKHFNERIWVSVEKNSNLTMLFLRVLESSSKELIYTECKEAIVKQLQEKLKDKRYLLVLDDFWNETQKHWDDFINCLLGINQNLEISLL